LAVSIRPLKVALVLAPLVGNTGTPARDVPDFGFVAGRYLFFTVDDLVVFQFVASVQFSLADIRAMPAVNVLSPNLALLM
jgi:hypothetical protein